MKQFSLSVTVLLACLTGASFRAHAQADESWYQAAVKYNALINKQRVTQSVTHPVVPKRSNMLGTGSRNIVNACDIITNGGFETQLAIPSHTNNMGGDFNPLYYNGMQYGATNAPDQLSNWYSPTAGSPDYFATNAATNSEVQPNNENSPYGSFTPYLATSNNDGVEGAIGLYARQSYYDSNTGTQRDRTSEYAQIDLGRTLPNGQYYSDFQVSLSHNTSTSLATNYGVNRGFGLVFSNTPNLSVANGGPTTPTISSRDFLVIPGNAQTVFNQSPITQNAINYGVTGNANWQRVSGQFSSVGNLRYVTVGLFNSDPANQVALPNHRTDLYNTYFFVDAIRIFKIPTAGPDAAIACGSSITLGEGCHIPNATYTWSAPGITNLPNSSSTFQVTVNPTANTTYTLTVNLPDGTTWATSVTVTITPGINDPQVQTPEWLCEDGPGPIKAYIDNYDPTATYTITTTNNIRNSPFPNSIFYNQTPSNPRWFFYLRSVREGATGLVTVTVTKCGYTGTTTFNITSPAAGCGGGPTESAVGYPNPATDRVQIPAAVESATLVNDKGKAVQKADASGRLDVQSLPDGLYNLQMMQNGKLINQRIQVKH